LRATLDPTCNNRETDWDLASDARPEAVQRLFKRVIPTGIKHGTVTVLRGGIGYEITTLRGEVGYSDGRRPDAVFFVDEIHEDLARRDFTINAIAYDPIRGNLEDPFGGIEDLRRQLIRAVGKASERFHEDGLRVLRAARFAATLEFDIDPETARAIAPSLDSFRKVSPERVRDEWVKIMKSSEPSRAFRVMQEHGLLGITAPLLAADSPLRSRLLTLALAAVDACKGSQAARFAALLHNMGCSSEAIELATPKAPSLSAQRSAELAYQLLQSLRFSNRERDRIVELVRNHSLLDSQRMNDADVRHWLRRVGPSLLGELRQVMEAVARARNRDAGDPLGQVAALHARAQAVLSEKPPLTIAELKVNGGLLKDKLRIAPGPQIGRLLEFLLELVLEHPEQNQPDALLDAARRWLSEQG